MKRLTRLYEVARKRSRVFDRDKATIDEICHLDFVVGELFAAATLRRPASTEGRARAARWAGDAFAASPARCQGCAPRPEAGRERGRVLSRW